MANVVRVLEKEQAQVETGISSDEMEAAVLKV